MQDKLEKAGTRVWLADEPQAGAGTRWDRYTRGLEAILGVLGESVEPADLLALSGDAFGLCFASNWQENMHSCLPTDGANNIARAYGYRSRWAHNGYSSELIDQLDMMERLCLTDAALEGVRYEIEQGRPVLTQGLGDYGCGAATIVFGYDRQESAFGHVREDGVAEWTGIRGLNAEVQPGAPKGYWNGRVRGAVRKDFAGGWLVNPAFLLGRKAAAPDAEERCLNCLRRAVDLHWAAPVEISWWGGVSYWFGREAYDQLAMALEELDYPAVLSMQVPNDAYDWYAVHTLDDLADMLTRGRTAAADYLRSAAEILPRAAELLVAASEAFRQEAAVAAKCFAGVVPCLGGTDETLKAWLSDPGSLLAGAQAVRNMQEQNCLATDSIAAALDAQGGLERQGSRVTVVGFSKPEPAVGKSCAFARALEATLSTTDAPFSYTEIMAYTGMAFGVNWFHGTRKGDPEWSRVCAIGERASSHKPFQTATGWKLRPIMRRGWPDMSDFVPLIVKSIEAGKPVGAICDCEPQMGLIVGFDHQGRSLTFRPLVDDAPDYEITPEQLGWLLYFLDERGASLSPQDALLATLRLLLQDWYAPKELSSAGQFFSGEQALSSWIEDLRRAESLDESDLATLFDTNWFAFNALYNARVQAVGFLQDRVEVLGEDAERALQRTVDAYQQSVSWLESARTNEDAFLGPWTGKDISAWTQDVRNCEIQLLEDLSEAENNAISEVERVLAKLRDSRHAEQSLGRLRQWSNLFGDVKECIKAADREPVFYELLDKELAVEDLPDGGRELHQYMSRLEPAEQAYPEQVDCLLASLDAGRLINPWPVNRKERQFQVKRLIQSLQFWLRGLSHAEAKGQRGTGEAAIDLVYNALGEFDEEKVTAVSMTVDKLEQGDLRDTDKELVNVEEPKKLEEKLAPHISMLHTECWTFDHNLKVLLSSIGAKAVIAPWGDPGGPIPWGGIHALNPRVKPQLLGAIDRLRQWLATEYDPEGQFGEPDSYAGKDWLAQCLLVYLEHHVAGQF